MSKSPTLRIHTDGASRGNPGKGAYAYIIAPEQGEPIEEAGYLDRVTNNQAEYTALVRALEHALELGAHHHLLIHSDSELLVKQMNGEYKVKNEDLRGLFQQAQELKKQFTGGVTIRHVRREQNSRADALGNEVLDGKRPSSPPRKAPTPADPTPSVRELALRCLHKAAAAWKKGTTEPPVEAVWDELAALLERQGARLPAGSR
jgi:ribonuclease HI